MKKKKCRRCGRVVSGYSCSCGSSQSDLVIIDTGSDWSSGGNDCGSSNNDSGSSGGCD